MKNRVLLFSVIFGGLALAFLTILFFARRSEDPAVLLGWLEKNKGDRQEIRMKLDMARGDVTGLFIGVIDDKKKSPAFRAEVLDLLLRQNLRMPEPRIDSALVRAIQDTTALVRRRAISGFMAYVGKPMKAHLIPFISDRDPEIRKIVYDILTQELENLPETSRTEAIKRALEQRSLEKDSTLIYYNRSLLGRAIAVFCIQGMNAYQRTSLKEGDSLLSLASSLDPENYRPAMLLSTWYAQNGRSGTRRPQRGAPGGNSAFFLCSDR
jgi:hypothetical protein